MPTARNGRKNTGGPVAPNVCSLSAASATPPADVKLVVLNEDRYVHLTGIVVREPRQGWITLEVPPLESWEQAMRWLTREQRERIESPEFYTLLQEQIGRRYLALSKRSP